MRYNRHLLLLLAFVISIGAKAQYNPDNPEEPGARPWKLTLKADPTDAASFNQSKETFHVANEQVYLQAYDNSGYKFVSWVDEQGNTLTTSASFNYIMPARHVTLTARYQYAPDLPKEPTQANVKRHLYLKANPQGAGSFNYSSNNDVSVGQQVDLRAYANQHYTFVNWTKDGEMISTSSQFTYTMPDRDATLTANFTYHYSPDSPGEPGEPQGEHCNIYAMREGVLPGQAYTYYIYMQNIGVEATGFSLDINFPKGFTVDKDAISLTSRATSHALRVENADDGGLSLVVSGAMAIEGVGGKILEIPVHVPDTATVGSIFPVDLKNGIVYKSDGQQSSVGVRSGSLQILRAAGEKPDSPDYVVSSLQTNTTSVMPGDVVRLSWQVVNQGNLSGVGGWTERIYLISADGRKVSIGSVSYDAQTLAPGAVVSRSADIALGQLIGVDGQVDVGVTIVPGISSGEVSDYQQNNSAKTTGGPLSVGKCLYLVVPQTPQLEGEVSAVRCQLSRSGSWNASETFMLTKVSGDDRLSMPESVTIPREQASAYFYIPITDNHVCDADSVVKLRIEAQDGYEAVEGSFIVRDDELPSLRVSASVSEVSEGDTFKLTVQLATPTSADLMVNISSEHPKRFRFPATAKIAAGQAETTVSVKVVDDDLPDEEVSSAFTIHAIGYEPAEAIVILKNDDMPVLELTLTPNKVKESDGPVCVTGVLRRLTNQDKRVTVRLSDDSKGALYFPQTELQLAKGIEQVTFNLGPIDNAQSDGDRTYTVNAAVWLSSCSCSVNGQAAGSVSAKLTICDDDGPALDLNSAKTTVREGVTTRLTVTRNTSTDQALTVRISSDYDDMLTYNHTVVIPAGQKSAYVEVTPSANSVSGDSQTIVFSAEADGFSSGTCWLMVTDQTLPDARIKNISVNPTEAEVGTDVTLTIEVENLGMAELRDATPIFVYHRNEKTPALRLYTQGAISPGESQTLTKVLTMPANVGEHYYYAVANEEHKIQELNYTNNNSVDIVIKSLSSFRAQVGTDKETYSQGDKVIVSGQISGRNTANAALDVYVINEGAREVKRLTTDAEGRFSVEWQLPPLQTGHFAVGACYPDENTNEEMASFDVYGLKRASTEYITCDVTIGESLKGEVSLTNPGSLALTGVKAEVISAPEGCTAAFDIPSTINGNQGVKLGYTLNGTVASTILDWSPLKVRVSSSEGAALDLLFYYYCRNAEARLACNMDSMKLNVTKGTTRDIPLQISNMGRGETGAITTSLPEGFSLVSASTSLKQNETATILLRFTPTNRMQLNVPVKGSLGVNCQNGNGLSIPFVLTLVSDEKGFLEVDACDEYTYNTAEAPHVEGASVIVKHPASGEVVAQGLTGKDGKYTVELVEGYYRLEVSAEKHEQYANYVFVNPAATERVVVNIGYQPITVSWNVEETEIEDEYSIETKVEYETNVPMPVVKMDIPKRIDGDNMAVGDAVMINAKLTNIGLIRAEEVTLELPQDMKEWEFEALTSIEPFSLLPSESVVIPIRITRKADTSQIAHARKKSAAETFVHGMFQTYGYCDTYIKESYKAKCGKEIKTNKYAERLGMKLCGYVATMSAIKDVLTELLGSGSGPGSPVYQGNDRGTKELNYGEVKEAFNICDTCHAKKAYEFSNFLEGKTPLGNPGGGMSLAIEQVQKARDQRDKDKENNNPPNDGDKGDSDLGGLAKSIIENAGEQIADLVTDGGYSIAKDGNTLLELSVPCDSVDQKNVPKARRASKHGWMKVFEDVARDYAHHLLRMDSLLFYAFGDRIWFEEMDKEKLSFVKYVLSLPRDYTPSDDELLTHKPASATLEEMRAFVNHIDGKGPNSPTLSQLNDVSRAFLKDNADAREKGFGSMSDLFDHAFTDYMKNFEEMSSSSVCASISLSFEQSMTMTRQAFRGHLKVFNGHENTPMKDVRLNLLVRDMNGNSASAHEFQINAERLEGFQGPLSLTDGWTLDAQATGTATILFIPTKYAAPAEPIQYSFGGTLTYVDPFTGLEVTRDLYPVVLTVKPSPELDLTYFMQRNVYADDPLTEEVEPQQPAEFALLLNNKGYGDATNVRMVTQQPQITENEKGLLIDFQLISSQVNGGPATLSFSETIANDFGTIPACSQTYAQWWLTSSLLGHFINYDVSATHVTSYGNEDLSLLDNVTIHELVHGFTASDGKRGFLVNDMVDAEDMPDMIYFTDATQKSVGKASLSISKIGTTSYQLTAQSATSGWSYASLPDPTAGKQKLVSVIRQEDGASIPVDNIWQTWCTLRDGKDPVHEKRLHLIADLSSGGQTYLLSFESLPEQELEVETFKDGPQDEVQVDKPLKEVSVVFNKPIESTTFTSDDLSLTRQGSRLDVSEITIRQLTDTEYRLNMEALTSKSGFYVLTVNTEQIQDAEGFFGSKSSQLAWTQVIEGDGIESIQSDESLQIIISPIPIGDRMRISGHFKTIDKLTVYSLNGVTQLQQHHIQPNMDVDVSRLMPGMYIVSILTDAGLHRLRVLKE